MTLEKFTKDDWDFVVTLANLAGEPDNVSSATNIQAAVVAMPSGKRVVGPVTVSDSEPGSDWDNGVIVIEFPNADTDVVPGPHQLEVQATIGGRKRTWKRGAFQVLEGQID